MPVYLRGDLVIAQSEGFSHGSPILWIWSSEVRRVRQFFALALELFPGSRFRDDWVHYLLHEIAIKIGILVARHRVIAQSVIVTQVSSNGKCTELSLRWV